MIIFVFNLIDVVLRVTTSYSNGDIKMLDFENILNHQLLTDSVIT